ncbi:MAG: M48 family peptidase, partial [Bacteroidia bacterium]|nr:M48 family peptidase [Bacteroidia bacterium]
MKYIIPVLSLSLLLGSCSKNAVTGKRAFTLLPESEMMAMSYTEYDKFLAEHPPLHDHDDRVIMVRRCGIKIQKAVE